VWGLAFKPETDDLREAPSLYLIRQLLKAGCQVRVYDPVAMPSARLLLSEQVYFGQDLYDTVKGTSAIFHVTEWKEFRMPDWKRIYSLMKTPLVIDGRNVFDASQLPEFDYLHIG